MPEVPQAVRLAEIESRKMEGFPLHVCVCVGCYMYQRGSFVARACGGVAVRRALEMWDYFLAVSPRVFRASPAKYEVGLRQYSVWSSRALLFGIAGKALALSGSA